MSAFAVWVSGGLGILLAAVLAWRWRNLPTAQPLPGSATPRTGAVDGLRVLAVTLWSSLIAGLLVPGLGGRLLMRIMAATSGPEAQGALTEANEIVGEITLGGTIGFLIFVGLLGGLLVAPFFPFLRSVLPASAWQAGLVLAVPLLGIVGVSDPLSPANRDFRVLEPAWLAVVLVIAVALLFGVTFCAVAARLDLAVPTLSRRPASILAHGPILLLAAPPLAIGGVAYLAVRAAAHGRLLTWITQPRRLRLVHAAIAAVVLLGAARTLMATAEILG